MPEVGSGMVCVRTEIILSFTSKTMLQRELKKNRTRAERNRKRTRNCEEEGSEKENLATSFNKTYRVDSLKLSRHGRTIFLQFMQESSNIKIVPIRTDSYS